MPGKGGKSHTLPMHARYLCRRCYFNQHSCSVDVRAAVCASNNLGLGCVTRPYVSAVVAVARVSTSEALYCTCYRLAADQLTSTDGYLQGRKLLVDPIQFCNIDYCM